MHTIDHQLIQLLSNAPPTQIASALLSAVEAVGALRGTLIQNEMSALLHHALFIRELQCENLIKGDTYSYTKILCDLSCKKQNSIIKEQASLFCASGEYISEKMERFGCVPATDFLKANECLQKLDVSWLSQNALFTGALEPFASPMNEILKKVFILGHDTHVLLKIATIYVAFLFTPNLRPFSILAFNILFTKMVNCQTSLPAVPIGLAKYQLLSHEAKDTTQDMQKGVLHFLNYLKDDFIEDTLLLRKMEQSSKTIANDLSNILPKLCSPELMHLLRSQMCLRNSDIISELKVTTKTAIGYMKQLEVSGFLSSIKVGQEKLYINKRMFSLVLDGDYCGA